MLCFIWYSIRTQTPGVGHRVGRPHHHRCWFPAVLEQGHYGTGFPESGFSEAKSVEWLSTSVLRQGLQFSFHSFVGWALVPVCLRLRSFVRCRIFGAKARKALGKLGQVATLPSSPTARLLSLASTHCHAIQWASRQLCSLFPGTWHGGGRGPGELGKTNDQFLKIGALLK